MPLFRIVVYAGTTHIYNAWDFELWCTGGYVHPSSLESSPESDILPNKCINCSDAIDNLRDLI